LSSLHSPRCGSFTLGKKCGGLVSPVAAAPVAMPVMAMPAPMAAVPAPVTAVPAMPSPVPVMSPAHLFGLEAIDLFGGGNRGVGIRRRQAAIFQRMRRQRRGLYAGGQRGRSGRKSKSDFQKVAAFHDISLFMRGE
jgi:hypothetical protein